MTSEQMVKLLEYEINLKVFMDCTNEQVHESTLLNLRPHWQNSMIEDVENFGSLAQLSTSSVK